MRWKACGEFDFLSRWYRGVAIYTLWLEPVVQNSYVQADLQLIHVQFANEERSGLFMMLPKKLFRCAIFLLLSAMARSCGTSCYHSLGAANEAPPTSARTVTTFARCHAACVDKVRLLFHYIFMRTSYVVIYYSMYGFRFSVKCACQQNLKPVN